jgi:hypothetical protein
LSFIENPAHGGRVAGFLLVKPNVWDKSRNYPIFVIVTIKLLEAGRGLAEYDSAVKR